jgi:hypothetical protein
MHDFAKAAPILPVPIIPTFFRASQNQPNDPDGSRPFA